MGTSGDIEWAVGVSFLVEDFLVAGLSGGDPAIVAGHREVPGVGGLFVGRGGRSDDTLIRGRQRGGRRRRGDCPLAGGE